MPIEDFASHSCNILVQKTGQDRTGAPVREPYSTVASNVPCIFDELGGDRQRLNDKATQVRTGKVYLFADFHLTTKHRIELIDSAATKGTRQLVVMAVSNPVSRGHHWEVDVSEQPV